MSDERPQEAPQEPPNWTPDEWIRQQWNAASGDPVSPIGDTPGTPDRGSAASPVEPEQEGAQAFQAAEPRQEPEPPPPPPPPPAAAAPASAFQDPAPDDVEDPLRALYRQQRGRRRRRLG